MTMAVLALILLTLTLFLFYAWKNLALGYKVLLSLLLGTALGFILREAPHTFLTDPIKSSLNLIGYGYLSLLKMLVIPLVLTSIIHSILNLGTTQSIKKISFLSCGMLLIMTAFSSLIGIGIGIWFNVGQGLTLPNFQNLAQHAPTTFANTILSMIPSNPIAAMNQENTIAIVVFSILLGLAARAISQTDTAHFELFKKLISALFTIVKKLASMVISLTPYGTLALIALLVLDQGASIFSGLFNFIAAMYTAILFVLIMHTLILLCFGYNPWNYFKRAYLPLLVAFTTRSSFGTLSVTESTLRDKFKTNPVIATFVPSMGATIGMNACAGIYPAILVIMTLTILHQPITPDLILMIMFINTVASLGISGLPGSAYFAASVTLTSLNLPFAVLAFVQGIDPIVDMGRTATNVNGVLTTALAVDKLSVVSQTQTNTILPESAIEIKN